MKFDFSKPTNIGEVIECEHFDMMALKMDEVGYFLIRVTDKLEVGLCGYEKVNTILRTWRGNIPQDIYMKILADIPELRKEHIAYLGKELARAYICLKLGIQYIQDGRMDGSLPEPELVKEKYVQIQS